MMSVEDVYRSGLCTQCGTCVAACPARAIEMIKDENRGVYLPKIDVSKCSHCGVCLRVCPGYSLDFNILNMQIFGRASGDDFLGNSIAYYLGYATDYKIRYNSSSGGLVTALLCYMLKKGIIDGALVTTMSRENPLEPKVILATTEEEIISASGSKYCPVPLNAALDKIINSDGRFAIVGLPCHIQGIRKFENINDKLRNKIVMHFGLFCANTASFLGTEYFLRKWGVQMEDIREIRYRGEGWPGKRTIVLKNGSKIKIEKWATQTLYATIHGSAFHFDFTPTRCLLCPDQTNELADISFGDAWLPELLKTEKVGVSLVMSRTEEGEKLLKEAYEEGIVKIIEISRFTVMRAGNFYYKSKFGSRINILKLFRRPVPSYIGKKLPSKIGIIDYMDFLLYLPSFFSSKRKMWPFLIIIAMIRSLLLIPLSILRARLIRK